MKGLTAIAMLSMMSWCDSLGDGCVPMVPADDDSASGGGSTAAASTDGGPPQTSTGATTQSSTGATPTDGGTAGGTAGTSQGDDTTVAAVDTTASTLDTTGSGDSTTNDAADASSGTASTDTMGTPPTCNDGEVEAPEECDTVPDPENGVLECDADCKAIRAVDLAAGAAHACVLLSDGRVRCWGDNTHGQRGAMNELEDVRLDADTLLIAGEGVSDFGKDVRLDTGNGRVFAGGATTCVTTAVAKETWCWGLGFGGEKPQATSGEYSAIAMGDVADVKNWWMCGLEWEDPKHVLRCWGSLVTLNKPLFEQLGNANTCFNAIDEPMAGTRLAELSGAVPKLDLGRELGCGPTGAAMLCAGYDGLICNDAMFNPCVANTQGKCPAFCDTNLCNKGVADVGIWDTRACYILDGSPSLVTCHNPTSATDLDEVCKTAQPFEARHIAVTQDFWCAVDPDQPAGDQVCCKGFDVPTVGLVSFAGTPTGVMKLVAQDDGILLLDKPGRVMHITLGAGKWQANKVF